MRNAILTFMYKRKREIVFKKKTIKILIKYKYDIVTLKLFFYNPKHS